MGATPAGAIVIVSDAALVPVELTAVSATTEVPAVVGVPLIAPVVVLRLKPAGRPVAV